MTDPNLISVEREMKRYEDLYINADFSGLTKMMLFYKSEYKKYKALHEAGVLYIPAF